MTPDEQLKILVFKGDIVSITVKTVITHPQCLEFYYRGQDYVISRNDAVCYEFSKAGVYRIVMAGEAAANLGITYKRISRAKRKNKVDSLNCKH